jgi:membrane-associated phospholipid phosphatase
LLMYVWHLPLAPGAHVAASAIVAVFLAGIPWSRIALSAHYGTDVLGGLLFGAAWLCLMTVALRHAPVHPVWRWP